MSYDRLIRDLEYQEIPEVMGKNQFVCQNICPMGNSIFKVRLPKDVTDKELFAQLPQKWKKKVLFGRQDLCIATFPDDFLDEKIIDNCVGNIDMLLTKQNVQELIKNGKFEEYGFQKFFEEKREQMEESSDPFESLSESSPSYY